MVVTRGLDDAVCDQVAWTIGQGVELSGPVRITSDDRHYLSTIFTVKTDCADRLVNSATLVGGRVMAHFGPMPAKSGEYGRLATTKRPALSTCRKGCPSNSQLTQL